MVLDREVGTLKDIRPATVFNTRPSVLVKYGDGEIEI